MKPDRIQSLRDRAPDHLFVGDRVVKRDSVLAKIYRRREKERLKGIEAFRYLMGDEPAAKPVQSRNFIIRGDDDLARAVHAIIEATSNGRPVEVSLRGVV